MPNTVRCGCIFKGQKREHQVGEPPPWQVQQPSLMSDGRLHSVCKLSRILPFLLTEHRTHKCSVAKANPSQRTRGDTGIPVWSWEGGTTR